MNTIQRERSLLVAHGVFFDSSTSSGNMLMRRRRWIDNASQHLRPIWRPDVANQSVSLLLRPCYDLLTSGICIERGLARASVQAERSEHHLNIGKSGHSFFLL